MCAVSRRGFVVPSLLWASCSAVRLRLRSLIFCFHLVLSAILEIRHLLTWGWVGWEKYFKLSVLQRNKQTKLFRQTLQTLQAENGDADSPSSFQVSRNQQLI